MNGLASLKSTPDHRTDLRLPFVRQTLVPQKTRSAPKFPYYRQYGNFELKCPYSRPYDMVFIASNDKPALRCR
jgi:hypothetical protein